MLLLLLVLFGVIGLLVTTMYLLGFRLGGQHWQSKLTDVRAESAEAARQMHDLTREAFIAMADHAFDRRADKG